MYREVESGKLASVEAIRQPRKQSRLYGRGWVLISTLRESQKASGEFGLDSNIISPPPLLFAANTNVAHKSSLEHLCGLHEQKTSRTITIHENAGSEVAFGDQQSGRQPWFELQLARELQAEMLPALPSLGFGFAELGTVTLKPQPGNERPRLFRDPARGAIFNRMGFNSLGATIVARHAGEMISEVTLAMTAGRGLRTLAKTIHPYPTQAEAIKRVADAYNRTRLTPFLKWLFGKWLSWTR